MKTINFNEKDIQTTLNPYTFVFNKFKVDEIEKSNKYLLQFYCNVKIFKIYYIIFKTNVH